LLHTNHERTLRASASIAGAPPLSGGMTLYGGKGTLHADAKRAWGWLLVLNGTKTLCHTAGNPFPAHPQFAQIEAKSSAWRRPDL
jgi:hypothetical protein